MITVAVPERGSVEIDADVWREVTASTHFWLLVEKGVVRVEVLRGGRCRLIAECYVGRAKLTDNIVLDVTEKVPGSLASLLAHAHGDDFRTHKVKSPTVGLGPLLPLLVDHFIDSVRRHASRGRPFRYARVRQTGSLVGGALDMTHTLQLWARGLRHLASFQKNEVTFDVPENRVVRAALSEVEFLSRVVEFPPALRSRARSMSLLFEDVGLPGRVRNRHAVAMEAEELAARTRDAQLADVLAFSAIILSHESFEHSTSTTGAAPRAWFLNLENLFEKAVRNTLRRHVQNGRVFSGRSAPEPIFAGSRAHQAHPDFVLALSAESIVGDAKYKRWDGTASAGDLYQLLVHAAAFSAKRMFLVFPHEGFEKVLLGPTGTGAEEVALFGIDVRTLDAHVAALLDSLGQPRGDVATVEQA